MLEKVDERTLEKYRRLQNIVADAGKVVVALSGGVDSSFLLKVCKDVLGDGVLAVTASSESFPEREVLQAKEIAKTVGCRHIIIETSELDVPGFSENPPHRCYLCKRELFGKISHLAREKGIDVIFEGSNADDTGDFRPGRKALRELGVRSPLAEAGLSKEEIRALSRALGLPNWERPPFACLASRFPYKTKITKEALERVRKAEDFLLELGFRLLRVRDHGNLARVELGEREFQELWERALFSQVVEGLKSAGYQFVTLDLEGYRPGSMNRTLTQEEMEEALGHPVDSN